jgi:hypothetical protein
MKIQYSKEGLVDFQTPVHVTEEQSKKMLGYFKRNFPHIEAMKITELSKEMKPRGPEEREKWTPKEYLELLTTMDPEYLEKKTGRSERSVSMKMAEVVPAFLSWLKSKGLENQINEENIGRFLKEARGLK